MTSFPPFISRLAVCSWSLQPETPRQLLDQLKEAGIPRTQIALDPLRTQPALWSSLQPMCADEGIELVSGMFVTKGEDYSTMESIKATGGLVPDATWDENWTNIECMASLARNLGLPLVTFHAGFLPHEESDPQFKKMLDRVRLVADAFAEQEINLAFETGQETAETLRIFLDKLDRGNVGVNFDPANMLLYEKGDPIQALKTLGPRLLQCHLKDANRTKQPGTWGEEMAVGSGEVDWPAFFQTLADQNFAGYLALEREAGDQRLADIKAGKDFVVKLLANS